MPAPVSTDTDAVGLVFDVQRFTVDDGPGIRTAVFLKGCPLHCPWCHNPEGMSSTPELGFDARACVLCGACVTACAHGAHVMVDDEHQFDRSRCVNCGACARVCPARALEIAGRLTTVREVLAVVERDRVYWDDQGGGLTITGGEPFAQPAFTQALARAAGAAGIPVCIETCGVAPWSAIEPTISSTELFLVDLKDSNAEQLQRLTGAPLAQVLDTLARLDARGARVRLRCPIIPTVNDTPEHLLFLAQTAAGLRHLDGVDVIPYHRLGESKARRFGCSVDIRLRVEPPAQDTVAQWRRIVQEHLAALHDLMSNQ